LKTLDVNKEKVTFFLKKSPLLWSVFSLVGLLNLKLLILVFVWLFYLIYISQMSNVESLWDDVYYDLT